MFDNNHEKRKKLTIDFITEKGYPNILPERILELGNDIYKLWEAEEVVPAGMSLAAFSNKLQELYMHNQIMSLFGVALK